MGFTTFAYVSSSTSDDESMKKPKLLNSQLQRIDYTLGVLQRLIFQKPIEGRSEFQLPIKA